jgi:ABC-2 type transport system ATP-binding protein
MPAPAAVEISECTYSYGETRALDAVSFQVAPRSIFGLLGPNGSGKTTLFRILSTLLAPESGSARLFGIDVTERPIEARRQVGVVFQSQSLDSRLTVEENLVHQGHMYGLRGHGLAECIGEVLEKVGLADRRKDRVQTLSGGLRRRADLAKGLLHGPKLLLLDEPSTGVDPVARLAFWRYLEQLRSAAGVTVLLTTHLLEEADACDELAILDRGKLIRQGTPADLKAEIGGEVVTLATGGTAAVAAALAEEFAVQDARVNGDEIRFEHPEGSKWAARLMTRFGTQIESVKISRPSLEDVFLHHAGYGFYADSDQRR